MLRKLLSCYSMLPDTFAGPYSSAQYLSHSVPNPYSVHPTAIAIAKEEPIEQIHPSIRLPRTIRVKARPSRSKPEIQLSSVGPHVRLLRWIRDWKRIQEIEIVERKVRLCLGGEGIGKWLLLLLLLVGRVLLVGDRVW